MSYWWVTFLRSWMENASFFLTIGCFSRLYLHVYSNQKAFRAWRILLLVSVYSIWYQLPFIFFLFVCLLFIVYFLFVLIHACFDFFVYLFLVILFYFVFLFLFVYALFGFVLLSNQQTSKMIKMLFCFCDIYRTINAEC